MYISPTGVRNGGGGASGGGYLRLLPPEHIHKVYCDQDHYGTVSGGGAETGTMGIHAVVGTGQGGCGGDADTSSGGGNGGGGGEDGQDDDGYGQLISWEYTVAKIIIGTEPYAPLAYAPVSELHHPIMSMLGEHRCRLEREKSITYIENKYDQS